MHATWFRAGAVLAVLALPVVVVPGCGKDEQSSTPGCNDCGGEGGRSDGAGLGGDPVSASGSSVQPNGGAGAAAGGGDAPGGMGATEAGGGQGGAAGAGVVGGEAGGGASNEGEHLALCARLANGVHDADVVTSYYMSALYTDCRVSWLFPSGQDYVTQLNQLKRFNFQFWGCPGTPPVYTFALVLGTPALSQGDVNLLIDHYLTAAQAAVDLTSLERQTMQAALVRLSNPLIVASSPDLSHSACEIGGAGGADGGGAAGAGGVSAGGAGGAAASSAGGAL
jgi:hypothetical protein